MATKGGKIGVYIPVELADAWNAWQERTGKSINLSQEVQGVIRRLIGEPSPEDQLADRLAALVKRVDRLEAQGKRHEKAIREAKRAG